MNLKNRWGVGFLRHHANHDRFPKQAGNWLQDEARRVYRFPSAEASDRQLVAECSSEALAQVISCLPELYNALDQLHEVIARQCAEGGYSTPAELDRATAVLERLKDL